MNANTTITYPVDAGLDERLARLATVTRQSKEMLSAAAVAAYVDHELAVIEGIGRGLADAAAGRVTPHDRAMDRIDAIVAAHR
jgi:predicted transcriptional regulator